MKYLGAPQSGSQANTTASRNRYGQYYRNRRTPVNPRTASQSAVRSALRQLSQFWATLTPTQQNDWKSYAIAHPVLDRLGSSIILSANAMFNKVNMPNLLFGAGISNSPPGSPPSPPFGPMVWTVVMDSVTPIFTVAYTPTPMPAAGRADVFVGGPKSAGVSFDKNLKYVGSIGATAVSPFDFTVAYQALWGTPVAGMNVFMRIKTYNNLAVVQDDSIKIVTT